MTGVHSAKLAKAIQRKRNRNATRPPESRLKRESSLHLADSGKPTQEHLDEGATSPAADIPENGGSDGGVQNHIAEFKEGEEEGKKDSQLGSGNLVTGHAPAGSSQTRVVPEPAEEE